MVKPGRGGGGQNYYQSWSICSVHSPLTPGAFGQNGQFGDFQPEYEPNLSSNLLEKALATINTACLSFHKHCAL